MTEPAAQRTPRLAAWRGRIVTIAIVWAVWALITTFIVQPFKIPSGSMENTLGIGDRIVVAKWTQGDTPKRGEVVVFQDALHWEPTATSGNPLLRAVRGVATFTHLSASGNHLVKRVIGLPGDRVSCATPSSAVHVNGVAVNEPYVHSASGPCASGEGLQAFSIVVPAGHVWVMGDHRNDSADSRAHDDGTGAMGSIPISSITGRTIAVVWPVTNLGGSPDDESAFSKVPAPGAH